jgi:hypothetical protein
LNAQGIEPAMGMTLDRSEGAAEGSGDLLLGHVSEIAKGDDIALSARELGQHSSQIKTLGCVRFVRRAELRCCESMSERGATFPMPNDVERKIGRGSDDPWLGKTPDLFPAEMGASQRFLRNVLGFDPVAENAKGNAIAQPSKTGERCFEPVVVIHLSFNVPVHTKVDTARQKFFEIAALRTTTLR